MEKAVIRSIKVTAAAQRLDLYIKEAAPVTRARAAEMITSGLVFVNGAVRKKPHGIIRPGDSVSFTHKINEKTAPAAFKTNLDIIYEEKDFIAVNKPPQMLTHPTKFRESDTLVNAVKQLYSGSSIHAVNRLDRGTSGIVLIALTPEKAGELSKLVMDKMVHKEYLCLVHGKIIKNGKIEKEISKGGGGVKFRDTVESGGMRALTYY